MLRRTLRALLFAGSTATASVTVGACGSSSDGSLGATVAATARPIEIGKLQNPAELDRALRQDVERALGGYARTMKSELVIDGEKQETLTLEGRLESNGKSGGEARLHLVHDTSHEDGYEAFLVEDKLHVRPRYLQLTWHRPEPGELQRLRAPIEHATADYVARLVKSGAALKKSERGDRIVVSIQGDAGTGELALDAKSGALLDAKLDAKLPLDQAGQPGRKVLVTLHHQDHVERSDRPIPTPTNSIPTPHRTRPQLDKQTLLGR